MNLAIKAILSLCFIVGIFLMPDSAIKEMFCSFFIGFGIAALVSWAVD